MNEKPDGPMNISILSLSLPAFRLSLIFWRYSINQFWTRLHEEIPGLVAPVTAATLLLLELHYGSEQPVGETSYHSLFHKLGSV